MRLEKAITTYLRGLPKDLAQTYRDEVIDCSVEDIRLWRLLCGTFFLMDIDAL